MRPWIGILVALGLTLGSGAAAQSTDGEVADDLLLSIVTPLEAALAEAGATGITMVRGARRQAELVSLQDEIGNFLYERGYEVHTVPTREDAPPDVPLLDFRVASAGFDYPARRTGFLGLGHPRVLRRGALGITGSLEDPRDGRWLWRGAPLRVAEEWVQARQVEPLAADRPLWMTDKPLVRPEGRSPWWERSLMAGLLAGVVILYADGTQ